MQLLDLIEKEHGDLAGKKIAVLGLSFKPDTDDIRESPAISVIKELISKKAEVFVYDPIVNSDNIKSPLKGLNFKFSDSLNDVIRGKDACLLITGWHQFKKMTPDFLKKEMTNSLLVDGRGFFDKKEFEKKINYTRIGSGGDKKIKE